jgi:hypothetical protein
MSVLSIVRRDSAYLRLARHLRFEADRADEGEAVDDVTGIPAGHTHGSHHAARLAAEPEYRNRFAGACRDTADAAQMRGEYGAPIDAEPVQATPGAIESRILDPYTGKPIVVERRLEDTPLNRARFLALDPITHLQWLAGTLYEADCAGESGYVGNTAAICANGAYRVDGGEPDLQTGSPELPRDGDGATDPEPIVRDVAWRAARVSLALSGRERANARLWLHERVEPCDGGMFRRLLDRLVTLYATRDDGFAFEACRATISPHLVDA